METYQSQSTQSEARQRFAKFLPKDAKEAKDVFEAFEGFPEKKQVAILSLSEDNLYKWWKIYSTLLKARKNYRKLDEALYADKIPDEDLAKANATLIELSKIISVNERAESDLLDPNTGNATGGTAPVVNPIYDRTARQGVPSIRPTNKRNSNRLPA